MSAPPQLPGIFHTLTPLLDHYGYIAVGGFVLLEDLGVPVVPGESILIAAAVYAGAGRLNVVLVALVGFMAAVIGDNIGFAIGHFGGRELILRWGKYLLLTPARMEKAERFFARNGGKVVVIARFIEGLRQANGIIAGISEMSWLRFLGYNALGAALWVALWTTAGYVAGGNINTLYPEVVRYEIYFVIGLAVLVAAYVAFRVWKWRKERAAQRDAARRDAV